MYAPADEYVPQCVPQEAAQGALFGWGALLALTLLILGAVFAAPVLLAHGVIQPAGVIYRTFSFLCHQIPERSFYLEGHPLGVCARCTGIYVGFAAGALSYPLVRSVRKADSPSRLWLVAACVPIAVDFALGFFGIWENTHFSRFATGAIFGTACALYVVPGFLEFGQIMQRAGRRARNKNQHAS
jgi:uncharacterized membrane protein